MVRKDVHPLIKVKVSIIILIAGIYNDPISFFMIYYRRANDVLGAETQMFEKFLKRVEPKDGGGVQQITTVQTTPSHSTHDLAGGGRMGRKRSKSRSSTMDRTLRLSAEQKCDIASREIEEFREEIERLREESEKVVDTYKVSQCVIYKYRSHFSFH